MTAAQMAHHLVSRAVDVTRQHYAENDDPPVHELQRWAAVLIFSTVALYLAVLSMVSCLAILYPPRLRPSKANHHC